MREIKFRAWENNENIMHYNIESGIYEDPDEIISFDRVLGLARYEVMQYTGLKDKNNKEIYEGDIFHLGDKNIKYMVVWNDTGLIGKQVKSSSYVGLQHWQNKIEVIGNIYEN